MKASTPRAARRSPGLACIPGDLSQVEMYDKSRGPAPRTSHIPWDTKHSGCETRVSKPEAILPEPNKSSRSESVNTWPAYSQAAIHYVTSLSCLRGLLAAQGAALALAGQEPKKHWHHDTESAHNCYKWGRHADDYLRRT